LINLIIWYQKEQYKISVKMDDLQEITDALFQLGVSYIAKGESQNGEREDFQTAIDNLKKAERNSKQLLGLNSADREAYRAQIYMNIGVATMNMKDPDSAIQFIEYAKKIFIRGGDKVQEAQSYANLAVCYDQKNDARKAIEVLFITYSS
jgi:tetratricopeptide (TPR) repeat protein